MSSIVATNISYLRYIKRRQASKLTDAILIGRSPEGRSGRYFSIVFSGICRSIYYFRGLFSIL